MTNPSNITSPAEARPKKKYNYTKKTGRPTKTPANCFPPNWQEIILELAAKGYAEVEMRAHLCMLGGKFNHGTWNELKKREEEFLEVIQKAKVISESWWINKARSSLDNTSFQTGAWYSCMKNMFKWQDKQEVTHSGDVSISSFIQNIRKK